MIASKKYAWFFMLLLCFSFVACSESRREMAMSGAGLMAEATAVDLSIQSGIVMQTVLKADLSAEELAILRSVHVQYTASREALMGLIDSPAAALGASNRIRAEYHNLREAYLVLESVVEPHYESYSPVDQLRLSLWRDQMVSLEQRYTQFVEQVNAQISLDAKQEAAWQLLKIATQIALTVV